MTTNDRKNAEDRIENAAQALFKLGLHDIPCGVLSGSGVADLLAKGGVYSGLNTDTPEARAALKEFEACAAINDIDRCI